MSTRWWGCERRWFQDLLRRTCRSIERRADAEGTAGSLALPTAVQDA
ncbi:hypothetical protein [Sorangium sp. So ce1024]